MVSAKEDVIPDEPQPGAEGQPLVIGVTGHRDLVPDEVAGIDVIVRELFTDLAERFPDRRLQVMSPLAEGADRVVALVAEDLGIDLIVPLPMPPAVIVDGARCPASYANFYLANGVALVPTFGVESDARALAVLGELWPERDVVGVPCATLVLGLGAIHCLSQQQPEAPRQAAV